MKFYLTIFIIALALLITAGSVFGDQLEVLEQYYEVVGNLRASEIQVRRTHQDTEINQKRIEALELFSGKYGSDRALVSRTSEIITQTRGRIETNKLFVIQTEKKQRKLRHQMEIYESGLSRPPTQNASTSGYRQAVKYPNGVYSGGYINGRFHGHGAYNWTETGMSYEGEWKNGIIDGQGKLTWGHRSKWPGQTYTGSFFNGQMHGQGTMVWPTGHKFEGLFDNGHPAGGVMHWPDGSVTKAHFANGQWIHSPLESASRTTTNSPEAVSTGNFRDIEYDNGDRYIGDVVDGAFSGKGTYIWANGDKYQGEWWTNNKHGKGIHTWSKGQKYVGEFKYGMAWSGWMMWEDGKIALANQGEDGAWGYTEHLKPTDICSFNNNRWNDFSQFFITGRPVYFRTDNLSPSEAQIVIWAIFSNPQDFALNKYFETNLKDSENYGSYARLETELLLEPKTTPEAYSLFQRRLRDEDAPSQIEQGAAGCYVYRIQIDAPDNGQYSSYVLGFTSEANQALGRVILDNVGQDINRALVGVIE